MKSDDVVTAIVAAMKADAALVTALGGEYVYHGAARKTLQVPSVEWLIVSDVRTENTERIRIQLDIWSTGYGRAVAIEERLRALFARDLPQTIGGLLMWTQLENAMDLPDTEYTHRMLDFVFEPTRERYGNG